MAGSSVSSRGRGERAQQALALFGTIAVGRHLFDMTRIAKRVPATAGVPAEAMQKLRLFTGTGSDFRIRLNPDFAPSLQALRDALGGADRWKLAQGAGATMMAIPVQPVIRNGDADWSRLDRRLNLGSNLVASLLALAGAYLAVTNLADGYRQNGVSGLYDTRSGRTGLFQGASVGLGYAMLARAGVLSAGSGSAGGPHFVQRMFGHRSLNAPWIAAVAMGGTGLMVANELGLFDARSGRAVLVPLVAAAGVGVAANMARQRALDTGATGVRNIVRESVAQLRANPKPLLAIGAVAGAALVANGLGVFDFLNAA